MFMTLRRERVIIEIGEKEDLPEYKNSSELKELKKRNRELTDIHLELIKPFRLFRKANVLPDKLWRRSEEDPLPSSEEYMFEGGCGLCFSKDCADVLKQFTLGESTLSPFQIHKLFTDELWLDDTFYILNLCEQRNHLAHPQDSRFMKYQKIGRSDRYEYIYQGTLIEPHEIMVKTSALECDVDLWHDPLFESSYFFSERLAMALIEAGFDKKWNLQPCKMV